MAEGQTVRLLLQRSVYTSGSVTALWTTTAHQAGALADYSPRRGSVSFATGQHTADIDLIIADDRQEEELEVRRELIEGLSSTLTFDLDLPKFNHLVPCGQGYD